MAESSKTPDKTKDSQSHLSLADRLAQDPAHPKETVQVYGFLAKSSRDGCLRIYQDLSLRPTAKSRRRRFSTPRVPITIRGTNRR